MLVQRLAITKDIGFITSCILYGARKGHYAVNVHNVEMVKAMKLEIHSIVTRGLLSDKRRASALIFSIGGISIATIILCETEPGEDSREIYAISVAKQYQNKGYGGQVLDKVLADLDSTDVYARCLSGSKVMKVLLECRGFGLLTTDGDYAVYATQIVKPGEMFEPVLLAS